MPRARPASLYVKIPDAGMHALLLVISLASCSGEDWSDPAKVAAANTDVQIIEAILVRRLQDLNQETQRRPRPLVVSSLENSAWTLDREEAQALGWGRPATWEAFFAAIDRPLRVPPGVHPTFDLISDFRTRLGRGFDGRWYGGGAGHPESEGYHFFDSLTVSPDGKEAIVYFAYVCSGNEGSASVYRLTSEGSKWRVENEELLRSSNPFHWKRDPDRTY